MTISHLQHLVVTSENAELLDSMVTPPPHPPKKKILVQVRAKLVKFHDRSQNSMTFGQLFHVP